MMTEGVRHGSAGPILHLSEYYSQNPSDWNGVPVTINHPQDTNGNFVSVNDVQSNLWVVGHIRNTHVSEDKLRGDAYIDISKAAALAPGLVTHLTQGQPLDVSIGAFTQQDSTPGTYGDRNYNEVTTAYGPDHLALLPGGTGACSWNDGCGIRTNENNEEEMTPETIKANIAKGEADVINGLQDNAVGFVEMSRSVQTMLDAMDTENAYHYLVEIYDDHIIYKKSGQDGVTYHKQEFTLNEADKVVFQGSSQQVRREVNFVAMSDEDCGCMKRTKFNHNKNGDNTMSEGKTTPSGEVMDTVVSLINNERTRFTKADRAWLLELNESQLATLDPMEVETPEVAVTREQAIEVLSEDFANIDSVKELVSEDVAEKIEIGLTSYNAKREALIKGIQANTSTEDWPTETLEAMETENLERIAKSVKVVDYSAQGSTDSVPTPQNNSNGDEIEPLFPMGVGEAKS